MINSKRIFRKLTSSIFIVLLLANIPFILVNIEPVSASPGLSVKWTRTLGSNAQTNIQPVAGDINGDGKLEVVVTGGTVDDPVYKGTDGTVTALDAVTGSTVWQVKPGGVTKHSPVEIIDINNDGLMEIIVSGAYPVVLHGSDGSLYWKNTDVSSYSLYSPVADIDGDRYSEIFVSSGLGPYVGDDYFTVLSYDGEVLRQTNGSWHPCWGGMAIGDANFDGVFELYQGDRQYGYSDASQPYNYLHKENGVSCLDPYTLEKVWNDNGILCSSHTPMLADVDKDGILDVVVTYQSTGSGGLAVLNAADGSVVTTGGKNRRVTSGVGASHSQPTIADLDGDGNLEIIVCRSTNPKIWDLYDWKLDATLPVICYEPPKVGDVTGDGKPDIIAPTGTQIVIYSYDEVSKTYVEVDRVTSGGNAFTLLQDVDNDGKNELFVATTGGTVRCFDTDGIAPTPRARSELQFYSERHVGVAEYVAPPGPQAPVVLDPSPINGEIGVPVALSQLSFTLTDFQSELMSYTVTTSPNIGSGSGTNVGNGRKYVAIGGLENGKTYTWQVDATDGPNWAHKTFTFTTKELPPWWNTQWQYRKTITIDPSQVSGDQTDFPVLVDMVDSDLTGKVQLDGYDIVFADESNVKLSHEIESYDTSTGHLVAWVRIPSVSSTSFTTFYMYYGNPTAPNQEDPATVWDTSYKLVLHLSEEHECRMWGMISNSLPHDIVLDQLISDSASLKVLGASNRDGWGLVWYDSATPEIRRGPVHADADPNFDLAANELADSGGWIGVGHVRARSSGGLPAYGDPHPFMRYKNGKWWAFSHNGDLDENTLKTLIGPEYLAANPPNYGANWDDTANVIDSDLYHLYVMKCIEESNWDVLTGIAKAVSTIPSGAANFILTDGETIWGFRRGNTLSYYQSTSPAYSVVASQPPDPTQVGWTSMVDYNLVILTRNNAPIQISDVRQFKLLTDSSFDTSADDAALRANGADQDWYESRNDVPTLLYLDATNVGGNSGKKAGFTASSGGNAYLTQEFGAPQTGVFSIQWDIYVDSILDISSPDRAGIMLIGSDLDGQKGPSSKDGERFVFLAFYKDTGATSGAAELVAMSTFSSFTTVASVNLDQWYTIKVVVNVPAGTYDIYVNGEYKATKNAQTALSNVTHVSFAQWNDGAGSFYVDNVFAPAPTASYSLDVNIDGSGTVARNPDSPKYYEGTDVTLTAVASPGYSFAGWAGDFVGSTNPVTVTMDSDKEVTATFVQDVYTLIAGVVGSGSVTRSPDLPTYNYGDEVTLTANPNAGYKFVAWSGDLSGTANPAVIIMTGNKVVTATFLPVGTQVCVDSSANGHIGILYGDVTQGATGVIDGAYAFDGINDYIQFAHTSALTGYTTAFTASFWLRLDDVSRRQAILNKYDSAGNQRGWYIEFLTHSTLGKVLDFFASPNGIGYSEWYASFSPTAGTWYYITVVWQANTVPKFYVNGVQVTTIGTATIASIFNNAGTPLYIGRSYTTGRYLKGSLDEIRLSNPARSADYILTSYDNQKNPSLFCQVGAEQSLPVTPIISNPNPANGATNVPIGLSKLSFDLLDYQNDLMDYTLTTNPDIGSATITGVASGTHSISVSGLEYGKLYTWGVSVTDGTHETTATYTFTVVSPLLVDSELSYSVDSADLRVNAAGQDWYESRADGTNGPLLLTLDTNNVGGNAGKKAGFAASASYNAYLTQEFSAVQTGVFSVQWDIYMNSILDTANDRGGLMMLGVASTSTPNRNGADRLVYMDFYKAGGGTSGTMALRALVSGGTATTIAADLNLKQWYTIRVDVNVATKAYDIYVDGVKRGSFSNLGFTGSNVMYISFAQWNDGAGSFYVDNVFSPPQERYKLTVNTVGSGSVSISSAEATYMSGTVVTLTAVPESGWYFSGWSGDLSSIANPDTVEMTGDKVVTATFTTEQQFTLTVNTVGSGSMTKDPDQATYAEDTDVTLEAIPATGWSFDGWSGDLSGKTNPAVITMTSAKTVTATFTQAQNTLTVNVEGGGSVAKTPDQSTYTYGTVVQLTATPELGFAFSHWTGDISGSLNPESVSMTGNKAVTAVFVWTQTNWWDAAWQYRRTITIDHTKVSGDQTDFPVLIDLTDSGLTPKALTSGYDFVFTDANEAKLSHEIETYESGTGHLVAWVKIPLLSSTTDTVLFMYYGNPSSANQQDTVAVWGSSDKMVLHLDEKTGTHYDSTVNGNNGTPYNAVTQGASGKIDGADTFDGGNDYVQVAHSSTLTGYTTSFTASFWLRLSDISRRQAILNKYDSVGNQRGWYIEFLTTAAYGKVLGFFGSQNGLAYQEWYASFNPTAGTWYHITVVWQANTVPRFYVNGAQVATIGTGTIASIFNNVGAPLYIGRSYTTGRYLLGSLDEIRIASPAPSASWMLTGYNSQSNPLTFYQIGTEEHYETPRYTLTINIVGQGSVTKDPSQITYLQDTEVQLTADAATGWTFDGWSGDLSGSTSPTSITMNGNKVVTVTFTQTRYTITASAGVGGSIDPVGDVVVAKGDSQSFTITADTGHHIVDVVVDGTSKGVVSSWDFTDVQSDHSITASFAIDTFTITVTQGSNGGIAPGTTVVNYGGSQSFTITANTGYVIADVVVDGDSKGVVSSWDFTDVQSDHSITASFALIPVVPLLVDSEFLDSVDSADLRLNGAGQDWYESRGQAPTLLYLDELDVGGNTGRKAGFTASGTTNAYLTQEFSSPQTGTFSVQWDIYVDSVLAGSASKYRAGQMMIGADVDAAGGPNRNDAERFVFLAFYKSGGGTEGAADLVAMLDFNTQVTVASGLSLDEWYTIRVVVDVATDTYDVYVDGVFKMKVDACTPLASVSGISFAQWDDGAGAFFVDNVFAPAVDRYKLTVNTVGDGTVTRDVGESSYPPDTVIELNAFPTAGWSFSGWSGALSGTDNPTTITMDGDKSVTATFTQIEYTLSVTIVGSGSVSKSPDQSTYHLGDVVQLSATEDLGWLFVGWSGDLSGNTNPDSITIDVDPSVTATFTLVSNSAPVIDSVVPTSDPTVAEGGSQDFSVTYHDPDVGDSLTVTWKLDTSVVDADDYYTYSPGFSEAGSHTVEVIVSDGSLEDTHSWTVTVTDTTFTITASAGVGGSISPSGAVVVAGGADQLFTITTHSGYQIAEILVDSVPQPIASTYTFYGVTSDHTIAASFSLLPSLLVDSTFDASVDSADLRSTGWYESRSNVPTLLYLDETDIGGNAGKKAGFTASSSGNAYSTQQFASAQTGTFTVQWDIYVDSILDISGYPDRAGWMLIGDDSTAGNGPNAANGERFVYMAFYRDGGGTTGTMDLFAIDRDDTTTAFTTIAAGLNIKQWYTIKVVCNLAADTYDVYVDGVLRATVTSRIAKTSVTHISFAQWNDGAGAFYVDNVVSPDVPSLLVDSTFDASVDSADLRSTGWYESRAQAPTLLSLDETNVGGNGGKKIGFAASSTTNAYSTQQFASAQTGTFTVQWDIYVDSILNITGYPDRAGVMMLGTTAGTTGPNRADTVRFVFLAFFKDGGATSGTADLVAVSVTGTSPTHTVVAAGLNLDQWYTIRVVVNVTAKTYEVFVDGVSYGSFAAVSAWAQSAITHISFAQWNDAAGAFYVDNVYAPARDTYTIVASADSGGSISPVGDVVVAEGNDQLFTITPDTGYEMAELLVDGLSVGTVTEYTFHDVSEDHTITASFVVETFTITVSQSSNGVIDPDTTIVDYGSTPSFTITPDTGYHIESITANGAPVTVTDPKGQTYVFDPVSADGDLTATFAIDTFTITVTQSANGVIDPPGTTEADYGSTPSFTITPDTGYHIESITANGAPVTVTDPKGQTYVFDPVSADGDLTATFAVDT
jgi:predicted glutamine amidotransferase